EGKLKKKDLEETPISEDEIPFEIPESWEWCRIGFLGDVVTGGTPSKQNSDYYGNDYPFYKPGDLDKGINISSSVDGLSIKGYEASRQLKANSVLVTCIGATIGKTGLILKEGACNQQINAIMPYNGINPKYIYYVISAPSIQTIIRKDAGQTTLPIMNKSNFSKLVLPIPSINEQIRIVQKIEEVLPHIKDYGEAYEEETKLNAELPEKLKKSILQEAIMGKLGTQDPNDEPASVLLDRIREEKKQLVKAGVLKKKDLVETPVDKNEIPFDLPDRWEWVRIKTIANKIVDGDHNPPKGLAGDSGYYMLSSKNINNDGLVELDSVRFLSFNDWEKCNERTNLKKGDVLLTTVGTLGRSCVYEGDTPYCFQRSVSIIQSFIFNYYLKYCFDSPFFQSLIDDKATGTAQRGFYLNQLEDAIIPLPPLAEQHRIVEKIEALFAEVDHMEI
ncbi:restriction endonuclease subunit S, partial [Segatella bryantii]|uniref:restriction endonuclease subunit S n=1 Tax=Segatella bryantii TaxID=77095 RepID=UPI00247884E2